MLVTWLGHAQLFVNAANKTLLMDPWFAEPVFGGAWFRYPPPPYPNASTIPRPDFLALSHIHPDHSGPKTLAQLPSTTPTYAMRFPSRSLEKRLGRAGYTNVHWLEAWETRELAEGLRLTFVPHHRGWEVSSMVLEADGVRVYHGNDNPLSIEAYREVVARLGKIDLAFLPYAGASAYPTGFDGDEATLKARCAQKIAEGHARFTDGIEGLTPGDAVPFASSWALLEESELWKNFVDRPTSSQALQHAMPVAANVGTKLLHMEPGDEWSAEAGVIRKGLTAGWDNTPESVRRYATQERARVQQAISTARASTQRIDAPTLDAAFRAYFEAMLRETSATTSELKLKAGFVAGELGRWSLTFAPGTQPSLRSGLDGDEDETLTLEAGELWSILTGPANWEDVWYGYRLRVKKRPGAGYFRAFWEMLLNFDDVALSEQLAARFVKAP